MRTEPAIQILEAAYRLDLEDRAWLQGLADCAAPLAETDAGVLAVLYDTAPGGFRMRDAAGVASIDRDAMVAALVHIDGLTVQREPMAAGLHCTTICETTSEAIARFGGEPGAIDLLYGEMLHPLGVHDSFNVQGADLSGKAVCVIASLRAVRSVHPRARSVWDRVAAHLAAALRLREALEPRAGLDDAAVVIDPRHGGVVHATRSARSATARERLRRAACDVDRARSRPLRGAADEALGLWKALVAGQFSLVDVFDSDGRRFIVAHENDPAVQEDRQLTRRERQAVELLARGNSDEVSAYTLGVAPATLRSHVSRAMRKLGIDSRAALIEVVGRLGGAACLGAESRPDSRPRT